MTTFREHPYWWAAAAALVVVVIGALVWSANASNGPTTDTLTGPTATPNASVSPAPRLAACESPTVEVGTGRELKLALKAAEPGQVILLESGEFEGQFTATVSGTQDQPIVLCGSADSILDGGDVDDGYVLHLDGADYWHLNGFSVTNGQKGVMADGTTGTVIEGLTVTKIGDEAIHLRGGSTDNVVSGNTISGTGHRRDKFGEGIYIGSAESNWCDISDCKADASDRNVIEGNTISDTTAEAIDIKEGTSDGIVRNNTFDGSGLQGDADSWMDVKGNGWLIEGNVGVDSPGDGYQTHEVVDGWGTDNVFRGNTAQVNGPGYGFALKPQAGNTVSCDNTATGAASGLSNEPCSG
jgi:parallel beta-helix repeat protein